MQQSKYTVAQMKISAMVVGMTLCCVCLISLPYCNPSNDLSGAFPGLEVYLWPQEPLWFQEASYFLPDTWGFDGKYRASSRSEARSSFLALLLRCLVSLGQVSKLTPGVLLQLVCVVSPMTMKWKAILRNSSGSSSGGWSGWRLVYVARGKWALKCQ